MFSTYGKLTSSLTTNCIGLFNRTNNSLVSLNLQKCLNKPFSTLGWYGSSKFRALSQPIQAKRYFRIRSSSFHQDYKKRFSSEPFIGFGTCGFSLGLLGFFEKKPELSPEDKLLMEIKRAILASREGEVIKAERHLAESWKMSNDLGREDVKTQIMDLQANLAFQKGELDKALRLFQLVTQRLVFHQGIATTDNAIVEISIKLAQIFTIKGMYKESQAGLQFCADTQVEKIEKQGVVDEDTLMLAAWSLQSLAHTFLREEKEKKLNKDDISKAAEMSKSALKYAVQAVGPDSQQAVAIRTDLASILALEGDFDGALEKLDECEKLAAEKHKYLQAAIRVNTGTLYLQKGEYSEAERICKEAKMMAGMFRDLESVIRADECIAKSDAMKEENLIKENAKLNSTN